MADTFMGSYRLIRKLGQGGMGAVYLGQHQLLGRRAAIKVLLPTLSADSDSVNRFFNEARAVTQISDPGIVQIFDFGYHTDGRAYIVMEYLEGEPMDRRLARLGKLSVAEGLRLGRQLASSLGAVHAQHIIHRDLKPENIFLVRDTEVAHGERSKILDFGIAKLSGQRPDKLKTHTGMLMGTPRYMSPEQCRGLAGIDPRSDIYALGCVLFHVLTGRVPFEGEGPGDILSAHIREPAPAPSFYVPGIPQNVDTLLLRCLAKAPVARFQTMSELAAVIEQVLQLSALEAPARLAPSKRSSPTRKAAPGPPLSSTTLSASSGQLAAMTRRSHRRARRIAVGLALAAATTAASVIATRDPAPPDTPATMTHEAVAAPQALPAAGEAGRSGSSTKVTATQAVVAQQPRPIPAESAQPLRAGTIDDSADAPAVISSSVPETSSRRHTARVSEPEVPRTPTRIRTSRQKPTLGEPAPRPISPVPPRSSVPAPPRTDCGKSTFEAIYNAAAPPKNVIRTALRDLNACHSSNAINDTEFEQIQTALVSRL